MNPSYAHNVHSVLYLTDSTKHSSGGNRQLITNALAMTAIGMEAYVIVTPKSGIAHELKDTPVHIILRKNVAHIWATALFLRTFTKKNSIDVVHTFHNKAAKAGIIAKLLGGRFRLFLNRGVIYPPNVLSCVFGLISNGFVCNSYRATKVLQQSFVPASRTHVIFNAVTQLSIPSSPHRQSNELCVTYVGNNNPVKGFDTFLQAVHQLRTRYGRTNVRFQSFGTHAKPGAYPDLPSSAYDTVIQHGIVPHEQVIKGLSVSNIFVLSSRQESMPNVLLEAFLVGLPAVCTDVGGIPDLICEGTNGLICPPDAPDCLASKIEILLNNAELRQSMGTINMNLAKTVFTPTAKSQLLLRLYNGEHILQDRPGR